MQATRSGYFAKGQLDAVFDAERRQMAIEHRDVHACRQLWRTVLQRTVDDICFLERYRDRTRLKKHEEERLRRIRENPPAEFIRGAWFEQICDYLQVNPERIRRAIQELDLAA